MKTHGLTDHDEVKHVEPLASGPALHETEVLEEGLADIGGRAGEAVSGFNNPRALQNALIGKSLAGSSRGHDFMVASQPLFS